MKNDIEIRSLTEPRQNTEIQQKQNKLCAEITNKNDEKGET